jgi:hypothetical protein
LREEHLEELAWMPSSRKMRNGAVQHEKIDISNVQSHEYMDCDKFSMHPYGDNIKLGRKYNQRLPC